MQAAFVILHTDCPGDSTIVEKVFTLEVPDKKVADVEYHTHIQNQIEEYLAKVYDGSDCFRTVKVVKAIDHTKSVEELMAKVKELCPCEDDIEEEEEDEDEDEE
jgi:hypothetical protein